jgi:hypothetical protein
MMALHSSLARQLISYLKGEVTDQLGRQIIHKVIREYIHVDVVNIL